MACTKDKRPYLICAELILVATARTRVLIESKDHKIEIKTQPPFCFSNVIAVALQRQHSADRIISGRIRMKYIICMTCICVDTRTYKDI